jgi:hypothetical protein
MTDETQTLDQTAPETPARNEVEQDTELQTGQEQLGEETGEPIVEDEFDEIEHAGAKYKVPKAVKPLLMMQSDYTRKTQEVAEQRKTVESEREAFTKSMEAQKQHAKDYGRLHVIEETLEQYQKVDWQTLRASDPDRANAAFQDYMALKDQRDTLAGKVQKAVEEQSTEAQRDFAKRYEDTNTALAQDIPGWAEAAPKVRDFALKSGVTMDDLRVVATNKTFAKLLHQAWVGAELISKQKAAAKAAAVRQPASEAEIKPLNTVSSKPVSGAARPGLHDGLSPEEWARRRTAQLRKRG